MDPIIAALIAAARATGARHVAVHHVQEDPDHYLGPHVDGVRISVQGPTRTAARRVA